jgi:hypothetical protein
VTSLWAQNVNSVDQHIVFMSSLKAISKITSSIWPEKIYLLHATSLIRHNDQGDITGGITNDIRSCTWDNLIIIIILIIIKIIIVVSAFSRP